MSETLYTRITPGFDAETFEGTLLAAAEFDSTYGFTELGYGEVDYDVAPIVLAIAAKEGLRWAGNDDVDAAAEQVGVPLWLDRSDYLAYWTGATEDGFAERTFREENTEANQLLESPKVVRALQDAGYEAFKGHITVTNQEPEVAVFWNRSSYVIEGPVEVVSDDPENPYHVRLASEPTLRI